MRTFEETLSLMRNVGKAMVKYAMVDRLPFDFGIGMTLYPVEIHLVTTVEILGGVGVTELASEFGVTKGAISQQVTKLVEKGLLLKDRDPENRVRVVVTTTELGKKASDNHLAFHREHDRLFLDYIARLDPRDYAIIEEMTEQMNLWMDNYLS